MRYQDFRVLPRLLPLVLLFACGGKAPDSPPAQASKRPVKSYTVRGTVHALPQPLQRPPMLSISHDEIPGYVDSLGEVTTMLPMTMEFPYARDVSLDGIAPGDQVEFTFVVDDRRMPPIEITRLQELGR